MMTVVVVVRAVRKMMLSDVLFDYHETPTLLHFPGQLLATAAVVLPVTLTPWMRENRMRA